MVQIGVIKGAIVTGGRHRIESGASEVHPSRMKWEDITRKPKVNQGILTHERMDIQLALSPNSPASSTHKTKLATWGFTKETGHRMATLHTIGAMISMLETVMGKDKPTMALDERTHSSRSMGPTMIGNRGCIAVGGHMITRSRATIFEGK